MPFTPPEQHPSRLRTRPELDFNAIYPTGATSVTASYQTRAGFQLPFTPPDTSVTASYQTRAGFGELSSSRVKFRRLSGRYEVLTSLQTGLYSCREFGCW
eukprot:scaffold9386_cov87-Skeletonema_menzelii.AAC.1